MASEGYKPIGDYAIIGDGRSAALVARDGSIDWLCWPRFDSASLFAAILDPDIGGCWKITPRQLKNTSRRYIPETNVLETTFATETGEYTLTDCMAIPQVRDRADPTLPDHEVLRRVHCTAGHVDFESSIALRPDYASANPRLTRRGELGIELALRTSEVWIRSSHELRIEQHNVNSHFALKAGETAWFSLSFSGECPCVIPPLEADAERRLNATIERWRLWSSQFTYDGPWREQVLRSALALRLMTYAPSGAIIAAPTTSLPERIGADLNWDYRFCWLRDASLTTRALNGVGFRREVDAFIGWMLNATTLTMPRLNVLYNVFGDNPPKERILSHLRGYCDSRPVRIHNAAADQLQLDVYGEVLDGVSQFVFTGGKLDGDARKHLRAIANYIVENWNCPDDGIWEPRGSRRNHTHSRLLCWVALDRLLDIHKRGELSGLDAQHLSRVREEIRSDILKNGWNARLQSYTATYGEEDMDASLLLLSWYGFEKPNSPRMQSTYRRIVQELRAGKDLMYRYKLNPAEGAFGICCFWEAEFLALGGGSLDEASSHFDRLLKYSNDVGLFAEEIDPETGMAIGNFPQAFTHVGLISAAISLAERIKGQKQLEHRQSAA